MGTLPLRLDQAICEFTADNMVQIKLKKNYGLEVYKTITFNEFCRLVTSISDAKNAKVEFFDTPELPGFGLVRCIKQRQYVDGSALYYITRDAAPANITYMETTFKNVGIPKLLMSIKLIGNTINTVYCCAVKDEIVTCDTILYYYPFSNVMSNLSVCFGGNKIYDLNIETPTQLHSIPDMFLSMPNNNDGYGRNLSGIEYRPLLEQLDGKPFNNEWLKLIEKSDYKNNNRKNMTFKDFI